MPKKKNRTLLLLILLLLLTIVAWYLLFYNKKIPKSGFVQQGITVLKGDPEISIWDYNSVDGDTINFYFDGKLIYENLGLGDTPVIYKTKKLSKGEHWIGIKAISEGTNAPATPHVSISSGNEKFDFDIDSWKDSASGSWVLQVQ